MAEDLKPERGTASSDKAQSGRRPRSGGRGHRGRGGRRHARPRPAGREGDPATSETDAVLAPSSEQGANSIQPVSADPEVGFASPQEVTSREEALEEARTETAASTVEEGRAGRFAEAEFETQRTQNEEAAASAEAAPAALEHTSQTDKEPGEPPSSAQRQKLQHGFPRHSQRPPHQHDPRQQDRSKHFRDRPRHSPPAYQPQPLPPPHQPASSASVQQAIEQVNHIIESLKETLDEMEEVLETLELAERQKTADEREIESLRRSLRLVQRPRENPPAGPRH